MADGVEIRTNLPDFKSQLAKFVVKMQNNIVRAAVNAAAQAFKKAVIAAAPELKQPDKRRVRGTLKRAIYVYRRRNPEAGTVEFLVSWRKGKKEQRVALKRKGGTVIVNRDAFYAGWLEAGWVPRGPGKALWRTARGGQRTRALARQRERAAGAHVVRRPFLVPGFNAARDAALAAFSAKMQERIDKAGS